MLKRLYNILVASAIFTVACCLLLLSYSKSNNFSYLSYKKEDALLNNAQNPAYQFWKKPTKAPKDVKETTWTTAAVYSTLGPCPDSPPKLVGPLRVEFDYERTWEEVTAEASPALQEGGRYKPPDCISKHKVGKFNKWDKQTEGIKYRNDKVN